MVLRGDLGPVTPDLSPVPRLCLPSQGGGKNPLRVSPCIVHSRALGMERGLVFAVVMRRMFPPDRLSELSLTEGAERDQT